MQRTTLKTLLTHVIFFISALLLPLPASYATSPAKIKGASNKTIYTRLTSVPAADLTISSDFTVTHKCLRNDASEFLTTLFGALPSADLLQTIQKNDSDAPAVCPLWLAALATHREVEVIALATPTARDADSTKAVFTHRRDIASAGSVNASAVKLINSKPYSDTTRFIADPLQGKNRFDLSSIPEDLHWITEVILNSMAANLVSPGDKEFRVHFDTDSGSTQPRLVSVDLLEPGTDLLTDRSIIFDRGTQSSVCVSLSGGLTCERALWNAPLRGGTVTRGIGQSTTVINQRLNKGSLSRSAKGTGLSQSVQANGAKTRKQQPGSAVKLNHGSRQAAQFPRTFVYRGTHVGIDFAAPTGTPVYAVSDGVVTFAGNAGQYGKLLIIKHAHDYETYYAHLSSFAPFILAGSPVTRGQRVASVGTSGLSTGPHLHFEVRKDGRYLDPQDKNITLESWTLSDAEKERLLTQILELTVADRSLKLENVD